MAKKNEEMPLYAQVFSKCNVFAKWKGYTRFLDGINDFFIETKKEPKKVLDDLKTNLRESFTLTTSEKPDISFNVKVQGQEDSAEEVLRINRKKGKKKQ